MTKVGGWRFDSGPLRRFQKRTAVILLSATDTVPYQFEIPTNVPNVIRFGRPIFQETQLTSHL